MKIGWLDDPAQDIIGGAALSSATLQENAPEGIEIVPCPNVDVDPDCDAYVIQNCTTYTAMDLIPVLSGKRIIKSIRDYWEFGDWQLRSWLSVHASVFIFNSPLHLESFDHPVYVPTEICPPPVDVKRFQEANDSSPDSDRRGIVWIGQMFPHKGVVPAIEWARDNGEIVDFYGKGPEARHVRINPERARYCGQIFYDDVPETLSRYSRFLFLPDRS
jgi:glycosyltransferase involved in cell wall biosynthesis